MPVLLKTSPGVQHRPFKERGRFCIEIPLCRLAGVGYHPKLQGIGPLKGVRINDLNPLWPKSMFRDEVMKFAKKFVGIYSRMGYELAEPEAEMTVWGPFRPYDWDGAGATDLRAVGYDDPLAHAYQLGVFDFLLIATFLNPHGEYELDDAPSDAAALAVELVADRERQPEYPYLWR